MKVGVIFHRLGPYHVARLSAAAEVCDLTAIELAADTGEYAWDKVGEALKFHRLTVFPEGDSRQASAADLVERLDGVLQENRPEVVAVPGWSDRGVFAAMRWCLKNGVPLILMSESTAWDDRRMWWKEWIKRRVVGLCSAALVGGTPHAEYMTQLGMQANRVFRGYDAVDNAYFAQGAKEVRGKKEDLGSEYRLPEQYFLASARFIEKKNLGGLIRAYADYVRMCEGQKVQRWGLVLLGDGPLRAELCRLIFESPAVASHPLRDLGLQDFVHLPGFKQYDELPVYYGLASAFVHASTTEQWGLVVNEAMASGLPVLVSNRCGCAADLVQQGRNGFTFDPEDIEQIAGLMLKMAATPSRLPSMREASREIISHWGTDRFAQGLNDAARFALEVGPKRLSLIDSVLLGALIRR